jgi:integrase
MTTRALTDSEADCLDRALLERHRHRDRLFLALALGTGFRVSELLSVDWGQLLTPSGEIAREVVIERAQLKGGSGARRKGVRSRRVPLNERVKGAVADFLASLGAIPHGPVFKSRIGVDRSITRGQAHRMLKGLASDVGLNAERIGCHSTRKAFALQVHRAAKFDLLKTQRILGHKSPLTTALYLETSQDELDSIVLGLGASPAGASPTLREARPQTSC